MKNKTLFELLILNCKEEIDTFIMEYGKSPKAVNPFRIIKEKENDEDGKE